jgi:hypothetical protein
MSWDVFVQDFPHNLRMLEEVPATFEPKPIGTRTDVIRCIRGVVPEADFSDRGWGTLDVPECRMEIELGDREELMAFAFHVHGGESAPGVVLKILGRLNLRAVDNATGLFLDEITAALGFEACRENRDQLAASQMN